MSLGSTVSDSSSSTLVDSADSGSQDEASLFWTEVSLEEKNPMRTVRPSTAARTIHLVTLPVNEPAICRCMGPVEQEGPTSCIGDSPEV